METKQRTLIAYGVVNAQYLGSIAEAQFANENPDFLRGGWPDFLSLTTPVAVEVKDGRHRLSNRQRLMANRLHDLGIEVQVWRRTKAGWQKETI